MRHFSSKPFVVVLLLAMSAPVWAQTSLGKDTIYAPKTLTSTAKRALLEGFPNDLARYKSPGRLEVAGEIIDVDIVNQIVNVRKSASINLTLRPKDGQGEAFHIESNSDSGRLTIVDRSLVLTGNLSGFYRVGDGPQTLLTGSTATFDYSGDVLNALIESEAGRQVELLLPAEKSNKPDALGPVTLRADSLRIDQKNGAAYFSGNARAFSTSGANKLDVTAPSFTVQRASDGTIGLLTTKGKTLTKLDIPPDPSATGVGKPTHLEITADKAVVNRATSTGVFEGNVKGFYRLQAAGAPAQNFDINGERATVTYDAKAATTGDGLRVVVIGSPVEIEVPGFDLKF